MILLLTFDKTIPVSRSVSCFVPSHLIRVWHLYDFSNMTKTPILRFMPHQNYVSPKDDPKSSDLVKLVKIITHCFYEWQMMKNLIVMESNLTQNSIVPWQPPLHMKTIQNQSLGMLYFLFNPISVSFHLLRFSSTIIGFRFLSSPFWTLEPLYFRRSAFCLWSRVRLPPDFIRHKLEKRLKHPDVISLKC